MLALYEQTPSPSKIVITEPTRERGRGAAVSMGNVMVEVDVVDGASFVARRWPERKTVAFGASERERERCCCPSFGISWVKIYRRPQLHLPKMTGQANAGGTPLLS